MNERTGRLLIDGELVPGTVRFEDERVTALDLVALGEPGDPRHPAELPIVAPGLIDLHVHGYGGCGPLNDLAGMRRALARAGTTACLATLFPCEPARLGACAEQVSNEARELDSKGDAGARVLGLHLEGPFVNPRSAGALTVADLAEPSPAALRAILGPETGDGRGVRTITLAPELPGAAPLIEELARSGVRVSLGHSLASAAEARAAARAGAQGATHLFNAMGPIHHRAAGLAGFALSADALLAEIIGDLVHVGREAFELALRARGPEGLALVSDALSGAGTGCDVFHSHGHRCVVADGAVWIEEEGAAPAERRLAGAAASQLEAVRRLVAAGVVSRADALTMGSATPARALGLGDELGTLAAGARADLIVLDPVTLELREVLVGGRPLLQ